MAMLAFGVVVGSLSGPGGVESLANAIVVSIPPFQPAPGPTMLAAVAPAASSGSGGGSTAAPASSAPTAAAPATTLAARP